MSDNTNIDITATVIDADHMILGRLSSHVAKRLLNGETIDIINAEKTIVSGSKVSTIGEYKDSMKRGSKENGPYYPKRPDMILKRTIRGMLPYKKMRGREAMANLKTHVSIPFELAAIEAEKPEECRGNRLGTSKYIQLGEVSKRLGAKY